MAKKFEAVTPAGTKITQGVTQAPAEVSDGAEAHAEGPPVSFRLDGKNLKCAHEARALGSRIYHLAYEVDKDGDRLPGPTGQILPYLQTPILVGADGATSCPFASDPEIKKARTPSRPAQDWGPPLGAVVDCNVDLTGLHANNGTVIYHEKQSAGALAHHLSQHLVYPEPRTEVARANSDRQAKIDQAVLRHLVSTHVSGSGVTPCPGAACILQPARHDPAIDSRLGAQLTVDGQEHPVDGSGCDEGRGCCARKIEQSLGRLVGGVATVNGAEVKTGGLIRPDNGGYLLNVTVRPPAVPGDRTKKTEIESVGTVLPRGGWDARTVARTRQGTGHATNPVIKPCPACAPGEFVRQAANAGWSSPDKALELIQLPANTSLGYRPHPPGVRRMPPSLPLKKGVTREAWWAAAAHPDGAGSVKRCEVCQGKGEVPGETATQYVPIDEGAGLLARNRTDRCATCMGLTRLKLSKSTDFNREDIPQDWPEKFDLAEGTGSGLPVIPLHTHVTLALLNRWMEAGLVRLDGTVVTRTDTCPDCAGKGAVDRTPKPQPLGIPRSPNKPSEEKRELITCPVCGEGGHRASFHLESEQAPLVCPTCGDEGHDGRSCPSREQVCQKCQQPGHNARACKTNEPCWKCHGNGTQCQSERAANFLQGRGSEFPKCEVCGGSGSWTREPRPGEAAGTGLNCHHG